MMRKYTQYRLYRVSAVQDKKHKRGDVSDLQLILFYALLLIFIFCMTPAALEHSYKPTKEAYELHKKMMERQRSGVKDL